MNQNFISVLIWGLQNLNSKTDNANYLISKIASDYENILTDCHITQRAVREKEREKNDHLPQNTYVLTLVSIRYTYVKI